MSSSRRVVFVLCVVALVSVLPPGMPPAMAFTEGASNNFFGAGAGTNNTGDNENSFFGGNAGNANTTGFSNSFFGHSAGIANTTGSNNAFFGLNSGLFNTVGSDNAFFGTGSGGLNTTGASNSFFGREAGLSNTQGSNNAFFGRDAGHFNTTGFANAFFGRSAGFSNTAGANNAFFGLNSGLDNTTGSDNAFFGSGSGGNNTTGFANAFFGREAGLNNTTGANNVFFGLNSGLSNTVGSNNAFVGTGSGGFNTTGASNSFFGREAGLNNTVGSDNAFFGRNAGFSNTTGNFNAFFGRNAGSFNTNEDANSFIGAFSSGAPGITNATAVGNSAQVLQSNSLVLGSTAGVNGAAADTDVGIGAISPAQALHVRRSDGTAELLVEEASGTTANRTLFELTNNGAPRFFFNDTSVGGLDWQFSKLSNNNFTISDLGDGGAELILQPNGILRVGDAGVFDLTLDAVGNLAIAGTLTESSDRAKKTDISRVDAAELVDKLRQLEVSTWRYKTDDLRHLGPMAQDFHRLFGVGTSTTISPRDLAALAVVVTQAQQKEIDQLKRTVADLSSRT